MKAIRYFLGANSADGFCSFYDALFQDPRIKRVWIIKGGAGNGKSTFMRTLAEAAAERGAQTEEILCSSDPDSLDGLVIPDIALAVVDGTAPHIVEPSLCGLDSRYLDFSACYLGGMERVQPQLLAAQRNNRRCYRDVYACLQAAASLRRQVQQTAEDAFDAAAGERWVEAMVQTELPPKDGRGMSVRRFFGGITPKGELSYGDSIQALCAKRYVMIDPFGVSEVMLRTLHHQAVERGYTCIAGFHPLLPHRMEQLLIPERQVAWLRTDAAEPGAACQLDLRTLVKISKAEATHIPFLLQTAQSLEREAVSYLQEAKTYHDALELACRPYVDFTAVDRITQHALGKVRTMLDAAQSLCK